MKEKPILTVGIPVYNEAQYIARTLDSLLNQTCRDFIIIVSDNCSTDNSNEIIIKPITICIYL